MNSVWMVLGIAPVLAAPLFVQSARAAKEPRHGLVRVADTNDDDRSTFEADLWREKLTQSDLESRERDFAKLVEIARTDDGARKALERWSKDGGELGWTSRLALREVGSARGGRLNRGGGGADDLRQRFDELERRFGSMDSMFEDMQRNFDRFDSGSPFQWQRAPGGTAQRSAQSYTLRVEPDGVKVEVQEEVDGKTEKKSYEAKSLDELYAAHPELRDKLGARVHVFGGGNLQPFSQPQTAPNGAWWQRANPDDDADLFARPLQAGPRTDILGVVIREPSDEENASAKLEDGVGLAVESVQAGTIADAIGVQAGDILIELNGRALKGRDDVREVLGQRASDEDVKLTLVDAKGKRTTLTWRADDKNKDKDKQKDKDKEKPKEKRADGMRGF